MSEEDEIFKQLDFMAQMVPAPFYWLDLEGRFIGLNERAVEAIGARTKEDVIGKTVYDLYHEDLAEELQKDIQEVLNTGQESRTEDRISDYYTGQLKHYAATRVALRRSDGNVIAVVGASIDISAAKKAEQLRLENIAALTAEQNKFREAVNQISHDLRSPLITLLSLINSCKEIPLARRDQIYQVANRIQDVARHMMTRYNPNGLGFARIVDEVAEPTLASGAIAQIVLEKRYEYQDRLVIFQEQFEGDGLFAFIEVKPVSFQRMISNLINNAVEATAKGVLVVTIVVEATDTDVKITLKDSGRGIPSEVLEKLRLAEHISIGKEGGQGLGLAQAKTSVEEACGTLHIESKIGLGTQIFLTFPRAQKPVWTTDQITLAPGDSIAVLDNDPTVHGVWQLRFQSCPHKVNSYHFKLGADLKKFLQQLSEEDSKSFLLLLTQELPEDPQYEGSDFLNANVKNCILITPHYADRDLRTTAMRHKRTILPKNLMDDVPLVFCPQPGEQT